MGALGRATGAAMLIAAGLTAVELTAAGTAQAADLTATVRGVKPGGGMVMIALFDSGEAFAAGRRLAGQQLPAAAEVRAAFNNLAPGRYLLAVYQDADGDEKLNADLFGVPTEAYGFGGDPPIGFGPPSFEAAAVTLTDQPLHLTATLTP